MVNMSSPCCTIWTEFALLRREMSKSFTPSKVGEMFSASFEWNIDSKSEKDLFDNPPGEYLNPDLVLSKRSRRLSKFVIPEMREVLNKGSMRS